MITAYVSFLTRRIFINILIIIMIVISVVGYLNNISTYYYDNGELIQSEKLLDKGYVYLNSYKVPGYDEIFPSDFVPIGNPNICDMGNYVIWSSKTACYFSYFYESEFFTTMDLT